MFILIHFLHDFGSSGDENVSFGWPRNSAPFRLRFPELLAPPGTRVEAGTMAGAAEVSNFTLGVLVPGCSAPGIECILLAMKVVLKLWRT